MASSRFSRTAPAERAPRLGSETPRVFTPPLRALTPQTSLGFSVIEFATDVLKVDLFPWQRWLLIHALELREGGGFRFRNVVVLVARQNGKSTLSQVLALWFMYVYGFDLVLGTAQDLDTAEEVWQGAVDLVTETDLDDEPVRPDLFELHARTVLVNGKKSLELKTGSRYKAKAASRRSGRGLSGDLVLLDELREHQNWGAWGAITKTTMARDEAMVWALSNAGDSLSVVLAYLRKMAHAAIGDPDGINADGDAEDLLADAEDEDVELDEDDDSLGIFEWSAPPGCDIWDRDGWAQANPSLGYKISERTVASAAKTDPEAIFRTEVLCQWVDDLEDGALDVKAWRTLEEACDRTGSVWLGVSADPDLTHAAIAIGFRRPDGLPHVSLAAWQPGTGWLAGEVKRLRQSLGARVLVDAPLRGLIPGDEVTPAQAAQAHNRLAQLITDGGLRHDDDAPLTVAVAAAKWRPVGDSRVLTRRGSTDVTPVLAAALAVPPEQQPYTPPVTDAPGAHTTTETGFLSSAAF